MWLVYFSRHLEFQQLKLTSSARHKRGDIFMRLCPTLATLLKKGEELNIKNFRGLPLELVIKSTVCNNLGGNSW